MSENSSELLKFLTHLGGDQYLKVESDLGEGFFRLNVAEAERRQAKHDIRWLEDIVVELIRNARDAQARQIFLSFARSAQNERRLTIIDDGEGIPSLVHEAIFEPRVTSKLDTLVEDAYGIHGRGMALYSIRENVEAIQLLASKPGLGSIFNVVIDTKKLPERKDQSTFPKLKEVKNKLKAEKGPRNILRTLTEFVLEHPNLNIYLGSPAEIISKMFSLGQKHLGPALLKDPKDLPFWLVPATAPDALSLTKIAKKTFDLEISSRNAHRILAEEIASSKSINDRIEEVKNSKGFKKRTYGEEDLTKGIAKEDLQIFSQAISQNFRNLGEKYFLHLERDPVVICEKRAIKICLALIAEENFNG